MPQSGTAPVRLAAGEVELTVLPGEGCRLGSLRVGGTELLRTAETVTAKGVAAREEGVFGYGSFPMVPWAGRVDHGRWNNGQVAHRLPVDMPPHAIHGTGVRTAWRAATPVTDDGTTVSAAFYYDLADPWPYRGRVTQLFELTAESLRTTLSVETAADSFPAQLGWHPWFRKQLTDGGAEARLDFAPAWQEERGADHLPTGRRIDAVPGPRDDCFGLPDGVAATVVWEGELSLEITADCDWLVVFDEPDDALCVEPQTGPPNGINTAPRLVTMVDPLEARTTWTWRVAH
ncbi:aldose epimerase family protein [Streptacidiphilus cavernicola]|uniref:Aldose 1-epimerase n=1 Tax=Streptacidiphilus cavernicola TaxID=3342716 RepID=A0ABV6VY15_9ACTN